MKTLFGQTKSSPLLDRSEGKIPYPSQESEDSQSLKTRAQAVIHDVLSGKKHEEVAAISSHDLQLVIAVPPGSAEPERYNPPVGQHDW